MNRFLWNMISWMFVAMVAMKSEIFANAIEIEENMNTNKLDNLINNHSNNNNVFLLDPYDEVENSIHTEKSKKIDREDTTTFEDQNNDMDDEDALDAEAIRKKRRKSRITDISVACFFFIAAVWLILATGYSVILLVLLRLQARGELDIYDENLGRVVLFNGRIEMHFGFLLRRYAIQLEEDYQRQLQQRAGDSNAEEIQRIRVMTREERRKAVEELLGDSAKTLDIESGNTIDKKVEKEKCCGASKKSPATCPESSKLCSEEEPVCSICLIEYEPDDIIFKSKSCPHMFKKDCLFSWLERRNNTECPCCRVPLVSDDEIWEVVQRMRKERRKERRKENRLLQRLMRWKKSRTNRQDEQTQLAASSTDSDRSDTSTSLTSSIDTGNVNDQESPSSLPVAIPDGMCEEDTDNRQESLPTSIELNHDDIGGDKTDDNTDEQKETSPNDTNLTSDCSDV